MPAAACTRSTATPRSAPARPRAASAACWPKRRRHPLIARYLAAIQACRAEHGAHSLPRLAVAAGACPARQTTASPAANCSRRKPRQLQAQLRPRSARGRAPARRLCRDQGAAAAEASATAKFGRGLVLIDPPYEAQLDEFDAALAALRDGLARWPQAHVRAVVPDQAAARRCSRSSARPRRCRRNRRCWPNCWCAPTTRRCA